MKQQIIIAVIAVGCFLLGTLMPHSPRIDPNQGEDKVTVRVDTMIQKLVETVLLPPEKPDTEYVYVKPDTVRIRDTVYLALPRQYYYSEAEGVLTTDNVDVAFGDFNGEENTRLIAEALGENSAAYKCSNYIFPNGVRGYLPSLGELAEIKPYLAEYNEAAALINARRLSSQFWSSTQYKSWDYQGAWGFSYFNNEDDFVHAVTSSGLAIPFGRLVDNTTYDEDNYIKFCVDKAEYYAPKGSTWSDWVNSTDSDGKIINYKGDICLASSTGYKVTSIKNETSGQVKPNDEIVPDRVYSFVYVIDFEV